MRKRHVGGLVLAILAAALLVLVYTQDADAHLVATPKDNTLEARLASQKENVAHAKYVCFAGAGAHRKWACHAYKGWLSDELEETIEALRPKGPAGFPENGSWADKQIWLAETIGPLHVDAWPNCPDPFDSRSYTWFDTLGCENEGNWLDSPGFYRCGLQFDPGWERKYRVRVCP